MIKLAKLNSLSRTDVEDYVLTNNLYSMVTLRKCVLSDSDGDVGGS